MKRIGWVIVMIVILAFTDFALAADGAKIYAARCFACHGEKGAGTPMAPALKGNNFVSKGDVTVIKKVIIEGRMGKDKKYPKFPADMPKTPMSEGEANALVTFLQGEMQK